MPNWCKNTMLITGTIDEVEKFIAQVNGEDSAFDFNKIIKMPKSLMVESSTIAEQAYAIYYGNEVAKMKVFYTNDIVELNQKIKQFEINFPYSKSLADSYHRNITEFNYTNWHDWCSAVWGTKWNACNPDKGDIVKVAGQNLYQIDYFFETAWTYPKGIYEEIAKQYPNLVVSIDVDEEGGYFWGNILIKNSQVIENLQEGTRPGGPYDYSQYEEE